MRKKGLSLIVCTSLMACMLTACGGSEESKETTVRKTEAESSITVVDNVTTEEITTSDLTTETTTLVVDNETTGEETTTVKVEDTSKQETTTKEETTTAKPTTTQKETTTKQETTTVKPTTTQKETTTKEQETTTQKETTTKPQETTSKEEETTTKEEETTEVWNKSVYEEAAIEILKDEYSEHIGFMDLNNDNIPELLTSDYYMNRSSIYVYENGEYILSKSTVSFCPWDSQIYMDKSKNILVFGVLAKFPGYIEEGIDGLDVYYKYEFNLINMNTGNHRFLGTIIPKSHTQYYKDCTPYMCHVHPQKTSTSDSGYIGGGYAGLGENEVNKTEFDKFMADVVKDYTFIKNADEIYVEGGTEKSVKQAYEIYSKLGL